jgi:hypothetical protein
VRATILVIPAQAGNQLFEQFWVPACAGMTNLRGNDEVGLREVNPGLSLITQRS